MPTNRSTGFALVALFAAVACGQPAAREDLPVDRTGQVLDPIRGGHVDSSTTGVVGLAFDIPGHVFVGHCSGTLIAPNLVLTARHCVSLTANADEQVECGVSKFPPPNKGDEFLASSDTVRPTTPDDSSFFRSVQVKVPSGATEFCGHDVALIILDGAGIPAELATPIVPRIDSTPAKDEKFSAEGFGLTDPDTTDTDGTRMRTDGNTVRCAGTDCASLTDRVRSSEWISTDAEVCPGDSGGPAIDEEGRVMGVASRGADGCSNVVYGNVASWRDFIIDAAKEAAARGRYPEPFWTNGSSIPGATPDGGTPTGPLGATCSANTCEEGYVCYADTGKPPGVCVPKCKDAASECPTNYVCSPEAAACVPVGSSVLASKDPGGGCAVGGSSASSSGGMIAAFAGVAAMLVRRRRRFAWSDVAARERSQPAKP